MIAKPEKLDPEIYYKVLIDQVIESNAVEALENSLDETIDLMESVPKSKEGFSYGEGKWNVKQVFQHLVDCERIMAYRVLSVARGEKGVLLGFDDQGYVSMDGTAQKSILEIMKDFVAARNSTISLVKSLPEKQLDIVGNANGIAATARMIIWFIAGHNYHHNTVIIDRYLT